MTAKKTKRKNLEGGQVMVFLVLGMVGLIGFMALAIDGGMIMVERRAVQSGADASSFSGGSSAINTFQSNQVTYQDWDCTDSWKTTADTNAKNEGIARASTNNYSIDADMSDANGISTSCNDGTDNGSFVDKYYDVETQITADVATAFAQFLSPNQIQTTNTAIARVRPQGSFAYGHAIVALNPADCQGNQNGANFMGTTDVTLNGGGVFSSGCWAANGSGLDVTVNGGENTYLGELDLSPNNHNEPDILPAPAQGSEQLPDYATLIPEADCSGLPTVAGTIGSGAITPGNYTKWQINGGSTITLAPGLYCISNGITINGGGSLLGTGVTLYITGGNFNTGGGAEVIISAPPSFPSPAPAIPGVLIYMPSSNPADVNLLGNSNSVYTGTVFAPTGDIEVGGSSSSAGYLSTQFIGWNVYVHGTAGMNITFDDEQNFQYPPSIELHK
jgi:hypothetical protein